MSLTTANTSPIFAANWRPAAGGAIMGPSANTQADGTGANTFLIYTVDSVDQCFVRSVELRCAGASGAVIAATVARLWWLNDTGAYTAGTTNTVVNTVQIGGITLGSQTISNTTELVPGVIPVFKGFPVSTKLLISFGTSTGAAGTGYGIFVDAGKY